MSNLRLVLPTLLATLCSAMLLSRIEAGVLPTPIWEGQKPNKKVGFRFSHFRVEKLYNKTHESQVSVPSQGDLCLTWA